jgi:prepilin-type N-terminal cleavage/methylation domain-containing protein
MQRSTRTRTGRTAFSLLELIIVIGILAVLVAISAAVMGNIGDTARRAATMTTIAKVNNLLQQQISAWDRDHGPLSPNVTRLAPRFSDPRIGPTVPYRLLTPAAGREAGVALARKFYFATSFAQTNIDAYGFDRSPDPAGDKSPDDAAAFKEWIVGNTGSQADSSELLYLSLTQGKFRDIAPVDVDSFTGSELADTDKDTFLEFVDAWGNPLRYYRWPTRLLNPFGYVATTLATGIAQVPAGTSQSISVATPSPLSPGGYEIHEVLNELQTADPAASVFIVVGREIMQVTAASAGSLTVTRGARSTTPADHTAGGTVKLLPFTDIVSLLLPNVNAASSAHDQDDPQGQLSPGVLNDTSASAAGPVSDIEAAFHTLDSFHAPLIISAGSDGELGLLEPSVDGTGPRSWDWGRLAQPETQMGSDYSILVDPANSTLNDNLTNHMQGIGN